MDTLKQNQENDQLQCIMSTWERLPNQALTPDNFKIVKPIIVKMFELRKFENIMEFIESLNGASLTELKRHPETFFSLAKTYLHFRYFWSVYEMIEGVGAEMRGHEEDLVKLWHCTVCTEAEITRGKKLTPLHKFRLKIKKPPPAHVWPKGVRPTISLPLHATLILWRWAMLHAYRLYPTRMEKYTLVEQTGLSINQVKTWFANLRRRIKICGLRDVLNKKKAKYNIKEEIILTDPNQGRRHLASVNGKPSKSHDDVLSVPPDVSSVPTMSSQTGVPFLRGPTMKQHPKPSATKEGYQAKPLLDRAIEVRCEIKRAQNDLPITDGQQYIAHGEKSSLLADILTWPPAPASAPASIDSTTYLPQRIPEQPNLQMQTPTYLQDFQPMNPLNFSFCTYLPLDMCPSGSYFNHQTYTNPYSAPMISTDALCSTFSSEPIPQDCLCMGKDLCQGYYQDMCQSSSVWRDPLIQNFGETHRSNINCNNNVPNNLHGNCLNTSIGYSHFPNNSLSNSLDHSNNYNLFDNSNNMSQNLNSHVLPLNQPTSMLTNPAVTTQLANMPNVYTNLCICPATKVPHATSQPRSLHAGEEGTQYNKEQFHSEAKNSHARSIRYAECGDSVAEGRSIPIGTEKDATSQAIKPNYDLLKYLLQPKNSNSESVGICSKPSACHIKNRPMPIDTKSFPLAPNGTTEIDNTRPNQSKTQGNYIETSIDRGVQIEVNNNRDGRQLPRGDSPHFPSLNCPNVSELLPRGFQESLNNINPGDPHHEALQPGSHNHAHRPVTVPQPYTEHQPAQLLFPHNQSSPDVSDDCRRQLSERGGILHLSPEATRKDASRRKSPEIFSKMSDPPELVHNVNTPPGNVRSESPSPVPKAPEQEVIEALLNLSNYQMINPYSSSPVSDEIGL